MSADDLDDLCPLCGRALAEEVCDRDHVFGEAFGGRVTVDTHRKCNNTFGSEAEGRLHRPNTLMSLIRAAHGLSTPVARGEAADGTTFEIDFSTGRTDERLSVAIDHRPNAVKLSARGAEKHLKRVIKDWRSKFGDAVPRWGDLPPESRQTLLSGVTDVRVRLTHDLNDARAFGVKAALEAGVVAYGKAFAASELAEALRALLPEDPNSAASSSPEQSLPMAVLEKLDEQYDRYAAEWEAGGLAAPDLPLLADSNAANDVIFVPFGPRQTALFVRVLGMPFIPGLVVDAPMPPGELGRAAAPVLVRESKDDRHSVDFADALLKPVAEQAEALARELMVLDGQGQSGAEA